MLGKGASRIFGRGGGAAGAANAARGGSAAAGAARGTNALGRGFARGRARRRRVYE